MQHGRGNWTLVAKDNRDMLCFGLGPVEVAKTYHSELTRYTKTGPLVANPRATVRLSAVIHLVTWNGSGLQGRKGADKTKGEIIKTSEKELVLISEGCFWSSGWSYISHSSPAADVTLSYWPSCLQYLKQREALKSCELAVLASENVILCVYWCQIGYIILGHTLQTGRKQLLNWSHGTVGSSSSQHCKSSFPSFLTLSCFSAGLPPCILKSQRIATRIHRRAIQHQGQRWRWMVVRIKDLRINMENLVAYVAMFLKGKLAVHSAFNIFF